MKKTLCILLTLFVLLAALPMARAATVVASGNCGAEGDSSNLTWTLDDAGTLTVSGSGKMQDYQCYEYGIDSPWYGNTAIHTIVIQNGVTSIGNYAFADCRGPTSVTIGNGVTSIGDNAFAYCTGLTSVTIGNGVTSIGDGAFAYCTGLTSVTIGNGVTSIGNRAFAECTGLTSVTIPDSVTSIGISAFYGCTGLTSVTIPDSVTSIGNWAFYYCTGLTSVTIPDSVTSIGDYAFSHCTGLTSVMIPDSVTSIGQFAFGGCTGLTSVSIGNGVTSIGGCAFRGCTGLTSVTIPDSVTSIGEDAFRGCTGLTSVTIPDGVTSIGGLAFYGCTGLTSVTIPDSVTHIGQAAFEGCTGLKDVYLGGSKMQWITREVLPYDATFSEANIHYSNHTWDDGKITTPATCTAAGVKTYTCTDCGATKTETIPATGHSYGVWTKLDDTQHQRVCANDNSHVEKENHTWDSGVITTVATCTKDGVKTYTCTVCNATKTEKIPATGHSYGAWTKLNDTQHQRVCANNSNHKETADHSWDGGEATKAPTCTKDGVKTCTCTVCGATKTEKIPATGHSYGAWTKLNDKQHQRVCANNATHTETAPHTWDKGTVAKAPTCTEAGETTYTCTVCGTAVTVPGAAATEHAWGEWTKLDGKQHKRVCANDPTHVETAEHTWDDGTVTTEPTEESEGVKTCTCTVCHATKTETIPKANPEQPAQKPGDVDNDGEITSADARLALRASVGLEETIKPGSDAYLAADADGDGEVTSGDARLILRASVGLEDPEAWGK